MQVEQFFTLVQSLQQSDARGSPVAPTVMDMGTQHRVRTLVKLVAEAPDATAFTRSLTNPLWEWIDQTSENDLRALLETHLAL